MTGIKSMAEMELDFIRLFPSDSVIKYGCVQETTVEGILVLITHVDTTYRDYDPDGWILNTVHFIPWRELRFYKCTAYEAHTGKRDPV